MAIPLNYAFGSITLMLFLAVMLCFYKQLKFRLNTALILPLLFYALMVLSLL
ncbi:hypothetical protein [Flavobacterium sp. 3HN19-14]|uniref:hypothetical protein n=1 Tax=Flavobacterium sp. 3HN19-14 TaxID=3448133 RepID=UPI003EE24003